MQGQHGGYPPMNMNGLMPGGGNLRVPPAWSPELEASGQYTFLQWSQDVALWAMATDVDPDRQGAAVVLQLGGTARALAREMDPQVLQNGQMLDLNDGNGPQRIYGVAMLLRGLARKFAPFQVETLIASSGVSPASTSSSICR